MTVTRHYFWALKQPYLWLGALAALLLLTACGSTPVANRTEPKQAAVAATPVEEPAPATAAGQPPAEPAEPQVEAIEPEVQTDEADTTADMAENAGPTTAEPEMTVEANQAAEAEVEAAPEQPAETATEQAEVAAPRPDLPLDQFVATDPATVSLASGQVQLVEFFAEW